MVHWYWYDDSSNRRARSWPAGDEMAIDLWCWWVNMLFTSAVAMSSGSGSGGGGGGDGDGGGRGGAGAGGSDDSAGGPR